MPSQTNQSSLILIFGFSPDQEDRISPVNIVTYTYFPMPDKLRSDIIISWS